MAARYGRTWTAQYGAAPDGIAAAEWRQTLCDLSRAAMLSGFAADALRGADWPPSSPGFLRMCRGIPSLEGVSREILGRRSDASIASPFARLVMANLDWWAFRQADHRGIARMLGEAYEAAVAWRMRGGELPPAVVELPAPGPAARHLRNAPSPVARATVAALRERFADGRAEEAA